MNFKWMLCAFVISITVWQLCGASIIIRQKRNSKGDGDKKKCKLPSADASSGHIEIAGKCEDLEHGKSCLVECKSGLLPENPAETKGELECNNGKWEVKKPLVCKNPEKCKLPSADASSDHTEIAGKCEDLEHGKSCLVECKSGLLPENPAETKGELECNNGKWEVTTPLVCKNPEKCKLPSADASSGHIEIAGKCEDLEHGKSCLVECKSGLLPQNPAEAEGELECNDGKWEVKKALVCRKEETCPKVEVEDATQEGVCEGATIGNKCTIKCYKDYHDESKKEQVVECTEGFKWEPTIPAECTRKKCPNAKPDNAIDNLPEQCTKGEKEKDCTITCKENHVLVGKSTLKCGANFHWSDEIPRCLDNPCKEGGAGVTACKEKDANCEFDSTVADKHYKCECRKDMAEDSSGKCIDDPCAKAEGPHVEECGKKNAKCQFDNTTDKHYKCVCENEMEFDSTGKCVGSPCADGGDAKKDCDSKDADCKFNATATNHYQCECKNDSMVFNDTAGKCVGRTCPKVEVKDATLGEDCEGAVIGKKCTIKCEKEYHDESKKEQEVECKGDFKWEPTPVECTRKKCPIVKPENSKDELPEQCTKGEKGKDCEITCKDDHRVVGDKTLKCGDDFQWSPAIPICVENMCREGGGGKADCEAKEATCVDANDDKKFYTCKCNDKSKDYSSEKCVDKCEIAMSEKNPCDILKGEICVLTDKAVPDTECRCAFGFLKTGNECKFAQHSYKIALPGIKIEGFLFMPRPIPPTTEPTTISTTASTTVKEPEKKVEAEAMAAVRLARSIRSPEVERTEEAKQETYNKAKIRSEVHKLLNDKFATTGSLLKEVHLIQCSFSKVENYAKCTFEVLMESAITVPEGLTFACTEKPECTLGGLVFSNEMLTASKITVDKRDLCEDNNCLKNSDCNTTADVAGYRCNCSSGFEALHSTTVSDETWEICGNINECLTTKPCHETSTVCEDNEGSYICHCKRGFTDKNDKNECKSVCKEETCKNKGICGVDDKDATKAICNCGTDWSGDDCSLKSTPQADLKAANTNVIVVGCVLGGLLLLTLIISAVIISKTKKRSRGGGDSGMNEYARSDAGRGGGYSNSAMTRD